MRRCFRLEICLFREIIAPLFINLYILQDRAYEASQKYKEGKFILEKNLLCDIQSIGSDVGKGSTEIWFAHDLQVAFRLFGLWY